jgi:hypothetical protein
MRLLRFFERVLSEADPSPGSAGAEVEGAGLGADDGSRVAGSFGTAGAEGAGRPGTAGAGRPGAALDGVV